MAHTLAGALLLRSKMAGNPIPERDIQYLVDTALKELDERSQDSLKFLGQGFFGDVFWLGDRKKVIKVTNDYEDAYASTIVKRKPDRNIVRVYTVFAFTDSYPAIYGIVNEKLTPLGSSEKAQINHLRKIWDKAVGQRTFITRENLDTFLDSSQIEEVTDEQFAMLKTISDVFADRHIKWRDLSGDNIMMRGRDWVVSDLGFSECLKQQIPVLGR